MKKSICLLMLSSSIIAFSQVGGSRTGSNNRWTYGGGLGLGFGSGGRFDLQVSPRLGYRLTNDFEMGLMGNFTWQTADAYKSTMFGVGPFANYYFGRNFFLTSAFQQYFINFINKYDKQTYRTDESALYLGGGYMTRIGSNAYFQVGLTYNVLWKENNSIFGNGLVPNIGFVVGL
ncbi:hypothetical protein ACK2M7_02005 [Chryseobacterium sp. TY4]